MYKVAFNRIFKSFVQRIYEQKVFVLKNVLLYVVTITGNEENELCNFKIQQKTSLIKYLYLNFYS